MTVDEQRSLQFEFLLECSKNLLLAAEPPKECPDQWLATRQRLLRHINTAEQANEKLSSPLVMQTVQAVKVMLESKDK